MKYLYELVDLLNQYDGSNREMENRIRDLVCYILDSSEYMQIDLYRSIVFEAAQKLRMFGYIKGTNRIAQDEFFYDNLNDIKHSAIQNYYKSKVFGNNLLDKRQKEVIDKFMSLEQKRILVSAPTSFGKTFLLREIIFLNRERYRNILLLFPTIALLNENTESVNQLIQELKLEYKIINNVYSGIEDTEKHIFILTPERALKLLADNANLSIDFFFFDEVYKIDEDFDRNEDSNEKEGEEELMTSYPNLKVRVLKAGHHGSKDSSSEAFLDQLKPSLALVSAGENNRYKHPNDETLERFKERHIKVLRTDQDGAIRFKGWFQLSSETVR